MKRRTFLRCGAGAALALLAAPLSARAQSAGRRGRFIFVFAEGGWDPLAFAAPMFASPLIDMDTAAERYTAGNLELVDHPERAPVRAFFEAHHAKSLLVHGISTRSVAHDICTLVAMTGSSSGSEPDFASFIGADAGDLALPSLVLSGPSFPGDLQSYVSRTGLSGQLGRLAVGDYFDELDTPARRLAPSASTRVDALLGRRARAAAGGAVGERATLLRELDETTTRAARLKDVTGDVNLSGYELPEQIDAAVKALELDLARSVSVGTGFIFDTHAFNEEQSPLLSSLFTEVDRLVRALESTPSPDGGVLADDTHVVVLSEMGRTPKFNDDAGRDHWPFGTALVWGPRVTGDRAIGGYDDGFVGVGVDAASGDTVDGAGAISAASFGATLLALADIDPTSALPTATPIRGVLR